MIDVFTEGDRRDGSGQETKGVCECVELVKEGGTLPREQGILVSNTNIHPHTVGAQALVAASLHL